MLLMMTNLLGKQLYLEKRATQAMQKGTYATDIQEEEIRMSINLPYGECTSEKLQCKLRSHKIRSTI